MSASPVEDEDIRNVYKYFSLQRHGALIRESLNGMNTGGGSRTISWQPSIIIRSKKPLGYVIYYIRDEVLRIKEIVYLTQEAKYGIWNYISAHFSMVNQVEGANYSGQPIAFEFEDSEIEETIKTYYMARIVDIKPFLEEYPFQVADEKTGLYFKVHDPVAEWNNGVFHLFWEAGTACCEKSDYDGEEPLVELDIGTLTTMMMGYKRPTYLYHNDRIKADYHVLSLLEMLIPSESLIFQITF